MLFVKINLFLASDHIQIRENNRIFEIFRSVDTKRTSLFWLPVLYKDWLDIQYCKRFVICETLLYGRKGILYLPILNWNEGCRKVNVGIGFLDADTQLCFSHLRRGDMDGGTGNLVFFSPAIRHIYVLQYRTPQCGIRRHIITAIRYATTWCMLPSISTESCRPL